MILKKFFGFGIGLAALGVAVVTPAKQDSQLQKEFSAKVSPVFTKYCISCHGGKSPAAGLNLHRTIPATEVAKNSALWQRLVFHVKSETMPPSGPKPNDDEKQAIIQWVQAASSADCTLADAGKVTIRRLNRLEYDNTIADLIGQDLNLSDDFPSDDVGEGFDNIGEVLTLSPLLFEKYLTAAEKAASAYIKTPTPASYLIENGKLNLAQGSNLNIEGDIGLFARSTVIVKLPKLEKGHYRLELDSYQQKAGKEDARLQLTINGLPMEQITVTSVSPKTTTYEFPIELQKQGLEVGITFVNDFYDPNNANPNDRDRNVYVRRIQVFGEAKVPALPNGIIDKLPNGSQDLETPKQQLSGFLKRAYRRVPSPQEVEKLLGLYSKMRASKLGYEESIRNCITSVLVSPNFLFRAETVDDKKLSGEMIATRLSYFLWSTMPDEPLMSAASKGEWTTEKVSKEVDRMLDSPKAKMLGQGFAMQWLQLRKLERLSPDPTMFPEFTPQLRLAMQKEVLAQFEDLVKNNDSILTLIDPKKVYVNEDLAKLYGISGVVGPEIRPVDCEDKRRGGLFGMAGVLLVTSNPNRTSPVKRGKWILEEILGAPPPPPMPNVGVLIDDTAIKPTLPMKERLALHRKKPECATCHLAMDAMGFTLENYDPIGKWRTKDGDFDIDATASLPDGKKLAGIADLKKLVLARKQDFLRCLTEKMLTYALGRSLRPQDSCHVKTIMATVTKDGFKVRSLIKAIATSPPFLSRATETVVK